MFQSYDDKFDGIIRRNAINRVRKRRFEQRWFDGLGAFPDGVATDIAKLGPEFQDEIKRAMFEAYEQGVWDGIEEEIDLTFEEEVKAEIEVVEEEAAKHRAELAERAMACSSCFRVHDGPCTRKA